MVICAQEFVTIIVINSDCLKSDFLKCCYLENISMLANVINFPLQTIFGKEKGGGNDKENDPKGLSYLAYCLTD